MKLVIPGQNLDDARARVTENDEVLDHIQETPSVENTFDNGFQLRLRPASFRAAVNSAPGHEPFAVCGERPEAGRQSVRDDQGVVRAKERGDLRLVGLQLVERPLKGCV